MRTFLIFVKGPGKVRFVRSTVSLSRGSGEYPYICDLPLLMFFASSFNSCGVSLTELGKSLSPIILAIYQWGEQLFINAGLQNPCNTEDIVRMRVIIDDMNQKPQ